MMASSLLIEAVDDGGGAEWMLCGEHALTSQETSQRSTVRPRSWILIYWSLHDIPLSFFTIYIRVPRSCEWLSAVYPLDKEVTHRGGETTFPSDASVH
jgi:hypothetical protein